MHRAPGALIVSPHPHATRLRRTRKPNRSRGRSSALRPRCSLFVQTLSSRSFQRPRSPQPPISGTRCDSPRAHAPPLPLAHVPGAGQRGAGPPRVNPDARRAGAAAGRRHTQGGCDDERQAARHAEPRRLARGLYPRSSPPALSALRACAAHAAWAAAQRDLGERRMV
jgi:hypothetical protein